MARVWQLCDRCQGETGFLRGSKVEVCLACWGAGGRYIEVPDSDDTGRSRRGKPSSSLPGLTFLVVGGYVWFSTRDVTLAFLSGIACGLIASIKVVQKVVEAVFLVIFSIVLLAFIIGAL